jgi:hypothetical protein
MRRRGNPNWGRALNISEMPVNPTAFERLTKRLGLDTERQQLASGQLREWAKRNYKHRYIPERLILKWDLASRFELENIGL